MDKTVKIRTYSGDEKSGVSQGNLSDDQNKSLELAKKNAQLEEERKKSLEQFNVIEQLRVSLKQEQAKMAEMMKKTVGPDANELAVKDAQLEEEKSRSLENLKTIVQLRESLKQEQAKTAEMVKKLAELEANELAKKNTQLQEEKSKSLELFKLVEQLRENLKQEQSKMAEMAKRMSEQEARAKESAVLEAKVKELTEAISMIAGIAATGKTG